MFDEDVLMLCTVNEQTKQTHQFEIVGWLTATIVLDSGLDPDHEE